MKYEANLFFYAKHNPTNSIFQIIMLIIEYFPTILITITCPTIIHQYYNITPSEISPLYFLFKFQLILYIKKQINILTIIFLIGILFFILLGYSLSPFIFKITTKETNWKHKWFNRIYCFFNDVLIFRTLNFYCFHLYTMLLVYCCLQSNSYYLFISIIIALLLIWYIRTTYIHITSNCVVLHLNNKTISNKILNYPYDWLFSMKHDVAMLYLKYLCSIEVLYFDSNSSSIQFVMFFFNIIITSYGTIYALYLGYNIIIKKRLEWFMFNRLYVFMRIGLFFFMWYTLIFYLLFLSSSLSHVLIASILCMSLIWTIITIVFIWKRVIKTTLYDGKITFVKIGYVLLSSSSSSLFDIDVIRLLNSFEFEYNLLVPTQFPSLTNDINSYNQILTFVFLIYRLYKKSKHNKEFIKEIDNIYSDIIQLLYHFSEGKILKYFCHFNTMRKKYKGNKDILINNIIFLVNTYLSKYDDNVLVLNDMYSDTKLHSLIKDTLASIDNLIQTPKDMMKPVVFFDISIEISKLKSFALTIIKTNDINENKVNKDHYIKNISQFNKYCLIIHRYVLETLANEVLLRESNLDMEVYEEYLLFHYVNDKTLILSTTFDSLSLNDNITLGKILKCGKELIKYKGQSITQIFPIQFRNEGIRQLSQKLSHYFTNRLLRTPDFTNTLNTSSTTLDAPFQFVINSSNFSFVELFNFSFRIVPTIVNNEMIINGFYSSNNETIIILRELDDELTLETYSPQVQNLLIFPPEWVEYLKRNNYVITMDEIFYNYTLINNQEGQILEYDCYFSYPKLTNYFLTMPDFNELYFMYLHNSSFKNKHHDLKEKLIQASDTKSNLIHLKLKYLFTITESKNNKHLIFSIVTTYSNSITTLKKTKVITLENKRQEEADLLNIYETNHTSNGTISYRSSNNSVSNFQTKRKELRNKKNKVNEISQTFANFSNLVLIFNTFMIIVCIIFLIVQIMKSQSLYNLNMLYYQFKNIQISFANIFLTIFSNICIANQFTDDCSNSYQVYSDSLKLISNFPIKYSTRDYVMNAMTYQVRDIQTQYEAYVRNVHNFKDKVIIGILYTNMNYIYIQQTSNQLTPITSQISLEEGLQKFINSLSVLTQAPNSFDDLQYSVHIISIDLNQVKFDNIINPNLNEVQREIYKIMINYVNYFSGYAYGEQMLIDSFNSREKTMKTILYLFIILEIIFHIILGILCRLIILISKTLFSKIIMAIITMLNTNKYKRYLKIKINILTQLNDLYIKNPINLIRILSKERKETAKVLDVMYKKQEILLSNTDNSNTELSFDNKEMNSIFFSIYLQIYNVFSIYFISVIVFDVFLLISYSNVIQINKYVLNNVGLETQLYNNIALPQIMTLVNMTQTELALNLGYNNPDSDGILNMMSRKGNKYKEDIFIQERNNPSLFPSLSSYFTYDCHSIITKFNDTITALVSNALQKDYIPFQIYVCEKFKVTSIPNFEYIFNEHNFRSQLLQDFIKTFSYPELYYFNEIFDFFDIFTLSVFVIKPLRTYINEQILYTKINNAFKQFIKMISCYLVFNIIADVLLYFIIKIFVLGRIGSIHDNLKGLNKLFTFHDKSELNDLL